MVFQPTTLFKRIDCPAGSTCSCINCIFRHAADSPIAQLSQYSTDLHDDHAAEQQPAKRRKITYDRLKDNPPSKADSIRASIADTRRTNDTIKTAPVNQGEAKAASSITRPVSPPRKSETKASVITKLDEGKAETLNPRVMQPAPASHSQRTMMLQHMHSDMARLNRDIKNSASIIDNMDVTKRKAFVLSDQALIKLALNEEEEIARKSLSVYPNLIRNHVAAYKRMTPDIWLRKLKSTIFSSSDAPRKNRKPEPEALKKTALALDALMPGVIARCYDDLKVSPAELERLKQYGYIFDPPSDQAIVASRQAQEACEFHEICDRCGTRFRVFHDRDANTGRLTSHGPCRYHWGRKVVGVRQKTDAYTGNGDATYRCCGQELGTPGCTEYEDHVYKASAPERLAAVLQFIKTPANGNPRKSPSGKIVTGVVFDCEMGYTTKGMELIRLTALRFPDKEPLLDVLVRPLGAIIDLNTRFSGVKSEHFTSASPFSYSAEPGTLQVVQDTATARSLLCEYLSGDTVPLMGHAIDNDLNAVRLCHTAIIDTVLLYPHRRDLPMRMGLKVLTKIHLERDIQMGGSEGHDSHEDADATHDLVIMKISRDTDYLKSASTTQAIRSNPMAVVHA